MQKSDSHAILRQNFGIPLDLVAGWRKNLFLCLYRNLEVLKEGFELILGGEAGVGEETINVTPFVETAIIEELEIVGNDEGYNMIS